MGYLENMAPSSPEEREHKVARNELYNELWEKLRIDDATCLIDKLERFVETTLALRKSKET